MLRNNGSKSNIMKVCRQIVAEEGIAGLNMRKVAKRTNLAIGSIYYYFPSKDELLIASIESVWDDIFSLDQVDLRKIKLSEYISLTYTNIKKGMEKYPNFLNIHSMSFSSSKDKKARLVMDDFLTELKGNIIEILAHDCDIREDVFDENFTKEDFADFIIINIISLWLSQKSADFTIKMIEKLLY